MLACDWGLMSHVTMASYKNFGDPFCHPPCLGEMPLCQLESITVDPRDVEAFFQAWEKFHLHGMAEPFWRDWPLSSPSTFFTSEALHHWFCEFYMWSWLWVVLGHHGHSRDELSIFDLIVNRQPSPLFQRCIEAQAGNWANPAWPTALHRCCHRWSSTITFDRNEGPMWSRGELSNQSWPELSCCLDRRKQLYLPIQPELTGATVISTVIDTK